MSISSGNGDTTIIHRILKLRKQMGIDNELSTVDPKDGVFFPSQVEAPERPMNSVHNRREWYAFGQDADGPHTG